jgi:hypothetical protein
MRFALLTASYVDGPLTWFMYDGLASYGGLERALRHL